MDGSTDLERDVLSNQLSVPFLRRQCLESRLQELLGDSRRFQRPAVLHRGHCPALSKGVQQKPQRVGTSTREAHPSRPRLLSGKMVMATLKRKLNWDAKAKKGHSCALSRPFSPRFKRASGEPQVSLR